MTPRMKFDKACAILLRDYPFWGSLVLNLKIEEDPSIPTMATDGIVIKYGPNYVAKQDLSTMITDIAHEGSHVGFLHPLRRGQRDPKLWNIAADYAINGYLKESGLILGPDYLYDPKYQGMDAEVIYNLLWQKPEQQPKDKNGQSKCGCGGLHDHPGKQANGNGEQKKEGPKPKNGKGQVTKSTQPSIGETEAKIRTALAQARAFAKSCGKLPASLDLTVEGILNPRMGLEDFLRQFLERCAMDDYTWEYPSRHHQHLGLYLPSMDSEQVSELVFVFDTSGSISSEVLNVFAAKMMKTIEMLPIEKLHVVYCDTKVQKTETYTKNNLPTRLSAVGGGGTDFRPPFKWVEEQGITPKALIYLTDLCCSSYPEQPHYPVLWVAHGFGSGRKVPFGEVIPLD